MSEAVFNYPFTIDEICQPHVVTWFSSYEDHAFYYKITAPNFRPYVFKVPMEAARLGPMMREEPAPRFREYIQRAMERGELHDVEALSDEVDALCGRNASS